MIPSVTILSDGKVVDTPYLLLSVTIQREVNRIPHAELVFNDGDLARGKFDLSETPLFEPGKEIEIRLGCDGADQSEFKGRVTRHSLVGDLNNATRLVVGVKDAAVKLTGTRRSAVYTNQKDSEIIGKILRDANIRIGSIADATTNAGQVVQYYCTDWDFILSRANAHGYCVAIDNGAVSVKKLAVSGPPAYRFDLGDNVIDFEFDADVNHQFQAVESLAWDLKNHQMTGPTRAKSVAASQGNFDAGKAAGTIGFEKCSLISPVPLDTAELQAWADGAMALARTSMLRGRISVSGIAGLKLLDGVALGGFGKRFSGTTPVTGFSHRIEDGQWFTEVLFGGSQLAFSAKQQVIDAPAAGLIPGLLGVQIGIVADSGDDPEKEFRVKVRLPAITTGDATVWARICAPDAGKQRGCYFRPEVGDEVVVSFLNNDPRHPVILGSLYGSKNTPPDDLAKDLDKNKLKGIVTKRGTMIRFLDDDKSSVFIQTPNKNKILLDDEAEAIKLTDQHGNTVTMDKNGIDMKSAKDFKIDASGNVEIKGTKVDLK
jgi:Rhs element Vgr protein